MMKRIPNIFLLFILITGVMLFGAFSQNKKQTKPAFYSGTYRNIFREAGYKQKDIDEKIANVYHQLFESSDRIYFEVGDSMGYVSDLKNHDARTEGLSYGMMIAVQLDKKDVLIASGDGQKNICSIRMDQEKLTLHGASIQKP